MNFGHFILKEFQKFLGSIRNMILYPRFFQIVINHVLTDVKRAAYA